MITFLLGILDIKSPTAKYHDKKSFKYGQWIRKKLGKTIR